MMKDIFPEDEYEKIRIKEEKDRKLLATEFLIALLGIIIFLSMVAIAFYIPMPKLLKICLFVIGFVSLGTCVVIAGVIEHKAGYFECAKCGYKYVPSLASFLFAFNMGRTRYFKCPECKKWSWSRKVISKD